MIIIVNTSQNLISTEIASFNKNEHENLRIMFDNISANVSS